MNTQSSNKIKIKQSKASKLRLALGLSVILVWIAIGFGLIVVYQMLFPGDPQARAAYEASHGNNNWGGGAVGGRLHND